VGASSAVATVAAKSIGKNIFRSDIGRFLRIYGKIPTTDCEKCVTRIVTTLFYLRHI
jgi:hypothetical protein